MSDSETFILVMGMVLFGIALFLIVTFFFRLRTPPGTSLSGEPVPGASPAEGPVPPASRAARTSAARAAADALAAEIQAGYVRTVAKTKCLQDQIQLLYTIRASIGPAHPLEQDKAEKFEENTKSLDRLADEYIVLYHELRVLMENENLIRSPEVLHNHRKQEVAKIRQLMDLSNEIQPLLNENEDIVAPFIGNAR